MKRVVAMVILYMIKMMLWLRYRVHYKGVENLNPDTLKKPGGILFLPNHPTIVVDPSLVVIGIYKKFPIRPMIVEYMYYSPGVNWLMRFMDAIPIPNHYSSTNSLKKKKSEQSLKQLADGVRAGENFLIYPAGKVKRSNYEQIGGASGVHGILQAAPEANVVLVRVKGLYGSIFSSALTGGRVPDMFPTFWRGVKIALKNFLFFSPRRDVTIEYVPAPADFPYNGSRLELNKYLEHWYNRPDGIDPALAKETLPGESLNLVSHSRWRQELPEVAPRCKVEDDVDIARIPEQVRTKIYNLLAKLTERDVSTITPGLSLSSDLGLDSLDAADILAFLQDHFDVESVPPSELTTVERLLAIAAKEVVFEPEAEEGAVLTKKWLETSAKPGNAFIPEGKTLPEVFFNACERWGKRVALADQRSGILNYSTVKLRALLLADYISKLDGKYIGIMLPATVAATVCILACQIARKVPVMINWTVGPRNLDAIIEVSKAKHILSSWAFLDKLENVDFTPVEDKLVLLEDLKSHFSLKDKLIALWRSKQRTKTLLQTFGLDKLSEKDQAVLLFTSGTESTPKGVPLTHQNIIANQRGALEVVKMSSEDILLAILPPFHSFGFTITSLIGLLGGIRTAFSPDPTNGKALARACGQWHASIICGAPTFLKALLRFAQRSDVERIKHVITGAEKAPPDLFELCKKFGFEEAILEGYGITECSPVVTINYPGVPHQGVGQPMPGVELRIVHPETHEPQPIGKQGLILVRGPSVFSGYLNPGLASPFIELESKPWYSTGDLGYLDAMGRLTLVGRLKRFVKMGGEMVSLAAIEDVLLEWWHSKGTPLSEDSPVLAVVSEDRDGDRPRVCLFSRFETSVDDVNASLRQAGFSNLVKVSEVRRLDEMPVMGTGKVNYRELKALMTEG